MVPTRTLRLVAAEQVTDALEDAAPEEEDPDAAYPGAPFMEGGSEEEWEEWVDWSAIE